MVAKMNELYPRSFARIDCNFGLYSEIAQKALCEAENWYNQLNDTSRDLNSEGFLHDEFYKSIIITIVFSSMCIESFLNDYAAACIGDRFFFDNLDHLSVLSKLEVISKFIFKKNLDKGQILFCRIKELFQLRDKFVHNKSRAFFPIFPTKAKTPERDDLSILLDDFSKLKEDLNVACNAIDTLYLVSDFFEKNDPKHPSTACLMRLYERSSNRLFPGYQEYVLHAASLVGRKTDESQS